MTSRVRLLLSVVVIFALGLGVPAGAEEVEGSISGRVVDEAGVPISGVTVVTDVSRAVKVTTDADGRYTIARRRGSGAAVTGTDPSTTGWHARGTVGGLTVVAGETTEAADLVLRDGGRIHGRVVDDIGQPLRCTIMIRSQDPSKTDGDGYFTTSPLLAGRHSLSAVCAPSYGHQVVSRDVTVSTVRETTEVADLVAPRNAQVEGRVEVPAGFALEDVRISASAVSGNAYNPLSPTAPRVDGTFRLGGFEPGRAWQLVVADHSGDLVTETSEPFTLERGEVLHRDVTMRRAGRLKVHVVDAAGRPARGTIDVGVSGSYGDSAVRTADGAGEVEIGGLSQGRWAVNGRHPVMRDDDPDDLYVGEGNASVKVYAGRTTEVTLRMPVGGRIEGRLTTKDHVDVTAGEVTLLVPDGEGRYVDPPTDWYSRGRYQPVSSDGTYRLGPVPAGKYALVVIVDRRSRQVDDVVVTSGGVTKGDVELGYPRIQVVKQHRLIGVARRGHLLRVVPGTWDTKGVHVEYRWYIDGNKPVRVTPTTPTSWRLPSRAVGHRVFVRAIATAPGHARTYTDRYAGRVYR